MLREVVEHDVPGVEVHLDVVGIEAVDKRVHLLGAVQIAVDEDVLDVQGNARLLGLGQKRADGSVEPALVTSGDDVADIAQFLRGDAASYGASDVIKRLLEGIPE